MFVSNALNPEPRVWSSPSPAARPSARPPAPSEARPPALPSARSAGRPLAARPPDRPTARAHARPPSRTHARTPRAKRCHPHRPPVRPPVRSLTRPLDCPLARRISFHMRWRSVGAHQCWVSTGTEPPDFREPTPFKHFLLPINNINSAGRAAHRLNGRYCGYFLGRVHIGVQAVIKRVPGS